MQNPCCVKMLNASLPPFTNERIRSFAEPADVASIVDSIDRLRRALPQRYPVTIAGKACETERTIDSRNPARPEEIVGSVGSASPDQARAAVEGAALAFERWKTVAVERRVEILVTAAARIRERRDEFNALLVLEVGKPWVEADADTAEAIDFLEFYAREALRYADPMPLTPAPGEENRLSYLPLGVGIVVPPWNFAFAIMAGMTAAAVVAGNTVVLKPSSDSPIVAGAFVSLLVEVGLPPDVVSFVPGSGAAIGDVLVEHPLTRFIAFTGSMEVGLRINELAAKTPPGQIWIKRVIAEMGGKDSIVVAADADLESAADGIVASAFGFAGQKCSACSRAIVEASVHDELVARIRAKVAALRYGDVSEPGVAYGPVINEGARRTILSFIARGIDEGGTLVAGGSAVDGAGFGVEPTVIANVDPTGTIAQEEIFGPVLAIVRADDYEQAIAIANNTRFGLTGSVYSADDAKLEFARERFFVGNLYFNRKCTGALVGCHPFGGFNMSGTDSKAGGYDYLALFLQAKTVSKYVGAETAPPV